LHRRCRRPQGAGALPWKRPRARPLAAANAAPGLRVPLWVHAAAGVAWMAALVPTCQWLYAVEDDWQPFALSASVALEAAFLAWGASGAAALRLELRSGACDVDFAAMRCIGPGVPDASGPLRREATPAAELLALRGELERLHAERDALAAELEQLRMGDPGALTARTSLSGWPLPRPSASACSGASCRSVARPPAATPGACTAISAISWRSAESEHSGLFSVSAGSLESIAEWVFALNPHSLRPKTAYERVLVSPGDPRRQWLEDYFLASLQAHRRSYNSEEWCPKAELQVMKIWEVINESANDAYRRELAQLQASRPGDRSRVAELERALHVRTDLSGSHLNEALLFHGCRWESVFAILREGFDSRLGGTNTGAAFGIGSYFSTVASKADQYTQRWGDWERRPSVQVPPELRCMLVARVALGEIHEMSVSDQTLRRPPLGPDGVRCDSVLGVPRTRGGCVDYDEFVVYKMSQATPQFVMEYEHKPECRCRSCVSPWA